MMWFAVWGEPMEAPRVLGEDDRIHLVPAPGSTHAQGWNISFQAARDSGHHCEYYFSLDDDLTWAVENVGRTFYYSQLHSESGSNKDAAFEPTVTDVLISFLEHYRPAITVFPWPWGDTNHEAMAMMNEQYKGQITQPATGFDNGCIIFHHSVVPFFIPVWLGKDFTAKFIVQHTFQNLFIPYLFMGHAMRFNGISYVNPPTPRHGYDSPFEYIDYLIPALKCPSRHWGPHLKPEDVWWAIVKPSAEDFRDTDQLRYYYTDILHMATFFDITHSAVIDHPSIRTWITRERIEATEAFVDTYLPKELLCRPEAYHYLLEKKSDILKQMKLEGRI